MDEKISVAIRPKPSQENAWSCTSTSINLVEKKNKKPVDFSFDNVYDIKDETSTVYQTSAKKVVENCMIGVHGTLIVYGQTSSGKTYTMRGEPGHKGIMELAMSDIFNIIKKTPEKEYFLRASYLEIYNENLTDLLNPTKMPLKLNSTSKNEVGISNLSEHVVSDIADFFEILDSGDALRKTASTKINNNSSRSHTLLRLTIESRNMDGTFCCSQLTFADLAGSERLKDTGAEGQQMKEGIHINKSLLFLGVIVSKLANNEKNHLPFRESKLTRILEPSLSGNGQTSIICTITLDSKFIDHTVSSLRFASRARKLTAGGKINKVVSESVLLKQYKNEIEELRQKLQDSSKNEEIKELEHLKTKMSEAYENATLELKKREEEQIQLEKKISGMSKIILNGRIIHSFKDEVMPQRSLTWSNEDLKRSFQSQLINLNETIVETDNKENGKDYIGNSPRTPKTPKARVQFNQFGKGFKSRDIVKSLDSQMDTEVVLDLEKKVKMFEADLEVIERSNEKMDEDFASYFHNFQEIQKDLLEVENDNAVYQATLAESERTKNAEIERLNRIIEEQKQSLNEASFEIERLTETNLELVQRNEVLVSEQLNAVENERLAMEKTQFNINQFTQEIVEQQQCIEKQKNELSVFKASLLETNVKAKEERELKNDDSNNHNSNENEMDNRSNYNNHIDSNGNGNNNEVFIRLNNSQEGQKKEDGHNENDILCNYSTDVFSSIIEMDENVSFNNLTNEVEEDEHYFDAQEKQQQLQCQLQQSQDHHLDHSLSEIVYQKSSEILGTDRFALENEQSGRNISEIHHQNNFETFETFEMDRFSIENDRSGTDNISEIHHQNSFETFESSETHRFTLENEKSRTDMDGFLDKEDNNLSCSLRLESMERRGSAEGHYTDGEINEEIINTLMLELQNQGQENQNLEQLVESLEEEKMNLMMEQEVLKARLDQLQGTDIDRLRLLVANLESEKMNFSIEHNLRQEHSQLKLDNQTAQIRELKERGEATVLRIWEQEKTNEILTEKIKEFEFLTGKHNISMEKLKKLSENAGIYENFTQGGFDIEEMKRLQTENQSLINQLEQEQDKARRDLQTQLQQQQKLEKEALETATANFRVEVELVVKEKATLEKDLRREKEILTHVVTNLENSVDHCTQIIDSYKQVIENQELVIGGYEEKLHIVQKQKEEERKLQEQEKSTLTNAVANLESSVDYCSQIIDNYKDDVEQQVLVIEACTKNLYAVQKEKEAERKQQGKEKEVLTNVISGLEKSVEMCEDVMGRNATDLATQEAIIESLSEKIQAIQLESSGGDDDTIIAVKQQEEEEEKYILEIENLSRQMKSLLSSMNLKNSTKFKHVVDNLETREIFKQNFGQTSPDKNQKPENAVGNLQSLVMMVSQYLWQILNEEKKEEEKEEEKVSTGLTLRNNKLQEMVQDQEKENKNLSQKINHLEQVVENLEASSKKTFEEQQSENSSDLGEVNHLELLVESLKENISTKEKENLDLKDKIDGLEQIIDNLEKLSENFTRKLEKLENFEKLEKLEHLEKLEKLEKENLDFPSSMKTNDLIEKLKGNLEKQRCENEILEEKIDSLETQVQNFQQQSKEHSHTLKEICPPYFLEKENVIQSNHSYGNSEKDKKGLECRSPGKQRTYRHEKSFFGPMEHHSINLNDKATIDHDNRRLATIYKWKYSYLKMAQAYSPHQTDLQCNFPELFSSNPNVNEIFSIMADDKIKL